MQQKLDEIEGEFIIFKLSANQKPKTFVYDVLTKTEFIESGVTPHPELLGTVKWYPKWRQYAFFPEGGTVFEKTCMTEITNFMKRLMKDRKK